MKWIKKGLIYKPDGKSEWMNNSFLQPTPLVLKDCIRIFGGIRDAKGRSRISFVDVDKKNPSNILNIANKPVLDIGKPGMFDENGVVPTAILQEDNKIFLYYAGYSLGHNVRFLAFTGLAICKNDDLTIFKRVQKYPVTDRVCSEELFRAIHSILKVGDRYKIWYGAGNRFLRGKQKTLPSYDIRYMESDNKCSFPNNGIVIMPVPKGCHRVGRPYVFYESNIYKMYYGYGSENSPYQLAYAESGDGINWAKKAIGLELSVSGWDSKMMAYPSFVRTANKAFLFYNGNDYGKEGFGYAELIQEN